MAEYPLPTYSFLDVYGTIAGPYLVASFGNGSGQSDEGITIDQGEDKNRQTVGASGEVMNTLMGTDSGRCSIHVLKTSPLNALLMEAFNQQKSTSLLWGVNTITVTNPVSGDHYTLSQCAFTRRPANAWAKEPAVITWEFQVGHIHSFIGA